MDPGNNKTQELEEMDKPYQKTLKYYRGLPQYQNLLYNLRRNYILKHIQKACKFDLRKELSDRLLKN